MNWKFSILIGDLSKAVEGLGTKVPSNDMAHGDSQELILDLWQVASSGHN